MDFLEVKTSDDKIIGKVGFDPDSETYSFEYSIDWIASEGSYPVSPVIGFESRAKSSTIKRFIDNLLPEGDGLDAIAQSGRISKSNTFALIRTVGQESTGGLILSPQDFQLKHNEQPARLVTDEELLSRIKARDVMPFSVWDGKVRLSIAGFQDKIAVFINDGKMFLVEHPLASTHIVKPLPRNPELSTVVANEYYCMSLADTVGLSAARTQIHRIPDPVLIVERFDRKYNAQLLRVDRLHVIDGCQLLDMPPQYKYERNFGGGRDVAHIRDGASLKQIFACARLSEMPMLFTQQLLRWTLFQYLIGNADAHAKNLSFHVRPKGKIALSPTYDVVSTVIYNGLDDTMALSIGDEFKFEDVRAFQWATFAADCHIPVKVLATEMRRMATNAVKHIAQESVDITSLTDQELKGIRRIQDFIAQQSAALLRDAELVKEVQFG
ncbi:MAG: HipA domain-containing protein [Gallionella sp.]